MKLLPGVTWMTLHHAQMNNYIQVADDEDRLPTGNDGQEMPNAESRVACQIIHSS